MILILGGLFAYNLNRHHRREALLETPEKTKLIQTEQVFPEIIRKNNLGHYFPKTAYHYITSIRALSDKELRSYADLFEFEKVEKLELVGPEITDDLIPLINTCAELTSLKLTNTSITPEGFKRIQSLNNLGNLELHLTNKCNQFLQHPERFSKLNRLRIIHSDLTGHGLKQIASLSALTDLTIAECEQLVPQDWDSISSLSSLSNLGIILCEVDSRILQTLPSKSTLRRLTIWANHPEVVSEDIVSLVKEVPNLNLLTLTGFLLQKKDAIELLQQKGKTRLETLFSVKVDSQYIDEWKKSGEHILYLDADLTEATIVDQINESISETTKEIHLYFFDSDVPLDSYEHLQKLNGVTSIVFSGVTLTDKHREMLHSSRYSSLSFRNSALNSEGLSFLKNRTITTGLDFIGTPVTSADLQILQTITLRTLRLWDDRLTDEDLKRLEQISPSPDSINIRSRQITAPEIRNLIKALPNTTISF
ncbi:MAG: hypothetical protein R3C11_07860 [Planctomycetaceae bacterium]